MKEFKFEVGEEVGVKDHIRSPKIHYEVDGRFMSQVNQVSIHQYRIRGIKNLGEGREVSWTFLVFENDLCSINKRKEVRRWIGL